MFLKKLALASVLGLSLTLAAGVAHAAPAARGSTLIDLPITQDHIMVGGSGYYRNIGQDDSAFVLAPQLEYFIMDRLSVGGAVGLTFAKYGAGDDFKFRQLSLAPSATYYFWSDAGMALYGNQQVALNFNSNTTAIGGKTGVGLSFFLNDSIAISPEAQVVYADKARGAFNIVAMITAFL